MSGPSAGSGYVDVHAHFLPPSYAAALAELGLDRPDGMPALPTWSAESALALMDRIGIETAILSISSPGVHLTDDRSRTRALAASVNDEAAGYMAAHPGRFGGFATLPLPDVDASVAEIGRALDELGLDGVVLLTNVGGTYLGDAAFAPVFDELHRREAVVFLHPTSPACHECVSIGLPAPLLEFPFDTTRTVVDLIASGTLERCPGMQLILPHAGGTLPFLSGRLAALDRLAPEAAARAPAGAVAYLQRLWYDLALSTSAAHLAALLTLVDPSRVLYGSDAPFAPPEAVELLTTQLEGSALLDDAAYTAIAHENARRLFPRLP